VRPKARLYLSDADGEGAFGDGRFRLLKMVAEEGSLRRAADRLGRGYRKAWGDIRSAERALGRKLVVTNRGGPAGGTTELTDFGREFLDGWERYRNEVSSCIDAAYGRHVGGLFERTGVKDRDRASFEDALRERVRREEAAHGRGDTAPDSLWDHLSRVAAIAARLGRAEGLDPEICRLAGLFHDAGKFHGGRLHGDDVPEERHSVDVLCDLAEQHEVPVEQVDEIAEAIEQLYRDDPEPTPLARVLFDADNLDKLGPLGVANLFVKRGLRGRGISQSFVHQFTVELTYARHAAACMLTATGREWARRRAPQTEKFLRSLLDQLREEGLADPVVEEVEFDGLTLDIVSPRACRCGGEVVRDIWQVAGLKCSEIHVAHTCRECADRHEIRFCRPRLTATA
jgi:molybdate transport repressor ModE-like protein